MVKKSVIKIAEKSKGVMCNPRQFSTIHLIRIIND